MSYQALMYDVFAWYEMKLPNSKSAAKNTTVALFSVLATLAVGSTIGIVYTVVGGRVQVDSELKMVTVGFCLIVFALHERLLRREMATPGRTSPATTLPPKLWVYIALSVSLFGVYLLAVSRQG